MSSIGLSKSSESLYRLRKLIALSSRTDGVTPRSSRPGRPGVGTLDMCSWERCVCVCTIMRTGITLYVSELMVTEEIGGGWGIFLVHISS